MLFLLQIHQQEKVTALSHRHHPSLTLSGDGWCRWERAEPTPCNKGNITRVLHFKFDAALYNH